MTELEPTWLEGLINKLGELSKRTDIHVGHIMSIDDILAVLNAASKAVMADGSLVEVDVPIKVIGDIHGQYADMHKLFDLIGRVPDVKMLFLGDYVDRGPQSIETMLYLLALKLRYKDRIFLLRGNHETPSVNRIYGFYAECAMKIGVAMWWEFQTFFNRLPMAGLIAKKILCMHGGLSPEITHLDQIRRVIRPCEPQDRGMLIDLVWSDPTNKGDGWFYSPRGISYAFGKAVMAAACKMLGIDLVIRAHQVVQDGYEIMVGRMLITVFSAPNYAGQFNNAGAVVCLDEDLQITFQQLRVPPPNAKCNRPCPAVACEEGKALCPPPVLKPSPKVGKPKTANEMKEGAEEKANEVKADKGTKDEKPNENNKEMNEKDQTEKPKDEKDGEGNEKNGEKTNEKKDEKNSGENSEQKKDD